MPTKKKIIEAVASTGTDSSSVNVDQSELVAKPKAKRASTAAKHKIVAVVTSEGIQGSFKKTEPRKPIIVNLPIKSSEVQFYDQPLKYDPQPPKDTKAFNEESNDPFLEESEHYDNNGLVEKIMAETEELEEKNGIIEIKLEKEVGQAPAATQQQQQQQKTAR